MRYKLGPVIRLADAPRDGARVLAVINGWMRVAAWNKPKGRWEFGSAFLSEVDEDTPCQVIEEDA